MKKQKSQTEKVDSAFVSSDKHWLEELKLFPLTPTRYIASKTMGMIYPNVGKEGYDQYQRTGSYPGELKDVIIGIWLCTIPDSGKSAAEWDVDRADAQPSEAYKVARAWAIAQGLHKLNSPRFLAAKNAVILMLDEIQESATEPAVDGRDDDEESGND